MDTHLKNKYELLWDQKSPEGYLKIMAVLQKYIDQGISVNTSYNPEHYEDNKIPMSEMLTDIVTAYKYGLKQLYYFNTFATILSLPSYDEKFIYSMITICKPTDFDKSRYQPEVRLKIDKYNRLAARKHGNKDRCAFLLVFECLSQVSNPELIYLTILV